MELYLDKRAVKQIRVSAADAIEEGDTETLKDDILEAFPEEQTEAIERLLGSTDLVDLIGDILDEWSGDDVDELFELLESQLGDLGIDLKYQTTATTAEEEDEDSESGGGDDDDEEAEEGELEEYDEYEEPGLEEDT